MYIIGIWIGNMDSACCLLLDGILQCAAQESWFSCNKKNIPIQAFLHCLNAADISIDEIDCISVSQTVQSDDTQEEIENRLCTLLGYDGKIVFQDHEISHVKAGWHSSGFNEAAILVSDTHRGWTIFSYGYVDRKSTDILERIIYPDLIGDLMLIVNKETFQTNSISEFESIAKKGYPVYEKKIRRLFKCKIIGKSTTDTNFEERSCQRIGNIILDNFELSSDSIDKGRKSSLICDIASSIQLVVMQVFENNIRAIVEKNYCKNVWLCGNMLVNYKKIFNIDRLLSAYPVNISQLCGDSGTCIGAAISFYKNMITKKIFKRQNISTNYFFGPQYTEEIHRLLKLTDFYYCDFNDKETELYENAINLLIEGYILAIFKGKTEFCTIYGGTKIVLANPKNQGELKKLLGHFKENEAVIYRLKIENCFTNNNIFNRELVTINVNKQMNPDLYKLLNLFYMKTGCPMLLCIPLSYRNNKINKPIDAIEFFILNKIDFLIMENFVISKKNNNKPSLSWVKIQLLKSCNESTA